MKKIGLVVAGIILSIQASAQTTVDRVLHALDSLTIVSVGEWKMSPDLKHGPIKGDPTRSDFDDSRWETLKLNQWVYPDSCWLRHTVVLPEFIIGKRVAGKVRFLVSVDDYGYMFVNGQAKGYFPWDGDFILTEDARPGDKFVIAIRAINTGGPLRILRAEIETANVDSTRQMIKDFSLSARVGQTLLSFDTKQTSAYESHVQDPGIDKSKMDRGEKQRLNELLQEQVGRLDLQALAFASSDKFLASLNDVRSHLAPVAQFAKRFILCFDANAHIDAAWLWREKETVEVCRNTFTSVLDMMSSRPDFPYTQSSAAYYDWMEQIYPEVFRRIQQRVNDRRWEVVGGMWVEPDCNIPSGESWMHHLLFAKKYFQKKLGVEVKIGWNPDSFGYNWNMPQFYRNAGIDAFITQKLGWNDTNLFPYRVFWWEAPDGSRILTYFPYDYVNDIGQPHGLTEWMRQFEANTGFTKMMVLFGVGDHGGGPTNEMLDRIERLKRIYIFPNVEYCTATQYFEWLRKQQLDEIPVWKDELYLEYHQGTFTTQASMKAFNRRNEVLLTNAEKFSTLATMFGKKYNRTLLSEAWKNLLFNQFHDILPGSGIREVYIDATERHKAAQASATYESKKSLERIVGEINTSRLKKGTPVVVFNPLSWERTDVATLELADGDGDGYSVFDANGKEVPSQFPAEGPLKRRLIFVAEKVPPVGYTTLELRKRAARPKQPLQDSSSNRIENEFFRVTVDTDSGWVRSIVDRRNGKEILSGSGNRLQLLEDKPAQWDAWNIGWSGREYPSKLRRIGVVERGPVRTVLRVERDCLGPSFRRDYPTHDFPSSFFTQDIILYNGSGRIDFTTNVDWWEERTMLKVAFPLSIVDTVATYEIPYGSIQRSTQMRNSWEKAKVEVPASRWADVSSEGYGVSLLNRSKYGYDIKGNVVRLSLLRSPKWPDPTADRGKHSIDYSLYPHVGSWKQANTVARGYEYNNPLTVMTTGVHKGTLPVSHSFVQLEPASLILTTIKMAEDSDAWVIQWYETRGEDVVAMLNLPRAPKNVVTSNFLEDTGTPVDLSGNVVKVPTRKNSVVTIKVSY